MLFVWGSWKLSESLEGIVIITNLYFQDMTMPKMLECSIESEEYGSGVADNVERKCE